MLFILFFRGSPPKGELMEMGISGYYNPTDPLSPIHESDLEVINLDLKSETANYEKSHPPTISTNNNENLKVQDLEADSEISKKPD